MLPRSGAFTSVVRFIVHMFCCKKIVGRDDANIFFYTTRCIFKLRLDG